MVNFIAEEQDFEGLRIDVQYGFDQHDQHNSQIDKAVKNSAAVFGETVKIPSGSVTDGGRTSVSIVGGSNSGDGNGNVTFYFNYQHTDPVLEAKRDFTACSLSTNNTATTFQYCGGSSTAFPGTVSKTIKQHSGPKPRTIQKEGEGSRVVGASPSMTTAAMVVPFTNAALYNFAPLNYLQRPDERYTAGEFSHYQLNPHLDIYSSFMFMHDVSDAQIAGLEGAFFGNAYSVNCGNNPLLTASEESSLLRGVCPHRQVR